MKTQNEMRGKFEKLEEVKNRLSQGGVYWDGKKYSTLPFMNSFVSTAIFLNGAWYAFQEQQKKIDLFNKMILGLRNEFNLWADDTESFNAIDAQIENLEELLK